MIQYKRPTWLFQDIAASADRTSAVQECLQILDLTIHVWWDSGSTPVGEFQLWVRVNPHNEAVGVFKQLTLSTTVSVTGATGSSHIVVQGVLGQWYLKYDRTSGDATINATWEGKSRG